MLKATYQKYVLDFKQASGTSRGVLTQKETWFLIIEKEGKKGIGECGILRTLSIDDRPDYVQKLQWVCKNIHLGKQTLYDALTEFPSIQFGVEMAFLSLESNSPFLLFPSDFTEGKQRIAINGLVWMGEPAFMKSQIEQKIAEGFNCIKLKIGAIDFDKELGLLQFIRNHFDSKTIEIRVDANGGFSAEEALEKLQKLHQFDLHSIEQPIKQNQILEMAKLCAKTPFPIALDEELIGIFSLDDKENLLKNIKPQYIILKPSLIGGFQGTQEWIDLAEKHGIGWWITSALESNIGLNAIAQFTFMLQSKLPQGLGTGGLYTNNFDAPLEVESGELWYNNKLFWSVNLDNFNF